MKSVGFQFLRQTTCLGTMTSTTPRTMQHLRNKQLSGTALSVHVTVLVIALVLFLETPVLAESIGIQGKAPVSAAILGTTSGYFVNRTLVLFNHSVVQGNFLPANGISPMSITTDGSYGHLYVTSIGIQVAGGFPSRYGNGTVSIVNASTQRVTGTVLVGKDPVSITYDPSTRQVFVANYQSGDISVISAQNDTVVDTIHPPCAPADIVADSVVGYIYALCLNIVGFSDSKLIDSATLLAIGDRTLVTVASESVPLGSDAIALDSSTGDLYIIGAYGLSGNVTIVSGSTDTVVSVVSIGQPTYGWSYDDLNGEMYLLSGSNLSELNTTSNTVVPVIPLPPGISDTVFDSAGNLLYLLNSSANQIDVLSAGSNKLVGTSNVGSFPIAGTFDPGTGQAYILNLVSNDVSELSGITSKGIISLGALPTQLALNGDTHDVCVATGGINYQPGYLALLNGTTGAVTRTTSVSYVPEYLFWDNYSRDFYLSNATSNDVLVFNASLTTRLTSVSMGLFEPEGLASDDAIHRLYVASTYTNNLSVINESDNNLTTPIVLGGGSWGVAFDPANGIVYVTVPGSDTVKMVRATDGSVLGMIPVGTQPEAVLYDPADSDLYVANVADGTVSAIDTTTGSVVDTLQVGLLPAALTYDPDTGDVLVANSGSDSVTTINATTNSVLGTVEVGQDPTALVYDPADRAVYVADALSGSLSILGFAGLKFNIPLNTPFPSSAIVWFVIIAVTVTAIIIFVKVRKKREKESQSTVAVSAPTTKHLPRNLPLPPRGHTWQVIAGRDPNAENRVENDLPQGDEERS